MGARINRDPLDSLPEGTTLRPIGDKVIIAVEDPHDSALTILSSDRPVRGTVIAVGPGQNLKKYNTDRSYMQWSRIYRPTEVRVGDRVELGGRELGGYLFDTLRIGGREHVICTERDIAAIYD